MVALILSYHSDAECISQGGISASATCNHCRFYFSIFDYI